jgi:hypothetical protein
MKDEIHRCLAFLSKIIRIKEVNMPSIRPILATILSLSMLFGFIPSALAGSATHFTVQLNDATIPWLFPPPDGLSSFCSEIPEGVHINPDDLGSDRLKQATQIEMPDGRQRIFITDLITGTASDNFDVAYTFIYENNVTLDYDGSTVFVTMNDTFKLQGGDVNFTVGFNWRWAYPAAGLEVFVIQDDSGQAIDIAVDPFPFATSDGVSEDPSIVPGSWEKVSTRGDPLSCDPL